MKFVGVVQNIIEILFILFCGFLAASSLFVHGAVNFETYEEKITLESRNPFLAILETVLFLFVLLAVGRLVTAGIRDGGDGKGKIRDKRDGKGGNRDIGSSAKIRRRSRIVGAVMVILVAVGGLLWIHVNPYPPYSDQKKVWDAAVALADGNPEGIDIAYFWIYPHQKKMAVVFWPIVRLFGTDPAFSIRVVNVVSAVFLSAGILALCKDTWRGRELERVSDWKKENTDKGFLQNQTVGALFCILFTPIVIYTCFVYGTLMAAAASVWSFHGILRLNQTGKLPYGLLPLLLLPFANLCYSSTRIAIVAAVITLILPVFIRKPNDTSAGIGRNGELPSAVRAISAIKEDSGAEKEDSGVDKEDSGAWEESGTGMELNESLCAVPVLPAWFRFLLAAGIVILAMAAASGADAVFDRFSGISGGDSYPYVQYLYMGITSPEEEAVNGPGSFVNGGIGSNWNGSNADEVNAVFRGKTEEALQDYLHHRRSLRFFVRKTWYQWMDPWFSSLTMTFSLWMRDIEIPDTLRAFMTGRPIRWMQHLLTILMSAVYLMALWSGVHGLYIRRKKKTRTRTKSTGFHKGTGIPAGKELHKGTSIPIGKGITNITIEKAAPAEKNKRANASEAKNTTGGKYAEQQGEWWQGDASFLLEIYFIGGFVFQLFWESKARYCFPYFLCLIPLAASGIGDLSCLLERRQTANRSRSERKKATTIGAGS